MATATKNQKLPLQQDPNKFYYHFVYKATLVLIFFVILPLFPSQAPEFINQSLLTRNWELLHLIFVGVAISYGLFSRRNDETEKDHNSKFDTAQSLVSRFLQVSSFFEDEAENPVESDETKVQTWSNQHHRNEPVLVVAPQVKKSYSFDDRNREKPLLLPVRSLKSRLSEDVVHVQSLNKSASFKRFSSNSNRKAEVETNDDDDDDVVVVHSQNRSTTSSQRFSNRNAHVEADDDDVDFDVQSLNKSTSSKRFSNNSVRNAQVEVERVENNKKDNVVLPSPIPWRSRSGRMEPKQEEINDASNTILLPSKEEYRPVKSQTSRAPQNLTSVPSLESLAKNAEDFVKKKGFYKSCPPPPPPPPPMMFYKSVSMKPRYASFTEEPSSGKELKRSFTSERKKTDEEQEQEQEQSMQRTSFRSVAPVSQPGENESFLDKVIVESDDDTESDDEDVENESDKGPPESSKTDETCCGSVSDEGPDVDKKADEFIAKFREQIRLQRIESIKRSTRTARNSSR